MSNIKRTQQVTPQVMSGTGHDVIELLLKSPSRQTVAVIFDDDEHAAAAESLFRRVAEFLPRLIEQRQVDTLKKLVSILLTDVVPSKAAKDE